MGRRKRRAVELGARLSPAARLRCSVLLVEDVIRCVRNECLLADVGQRVAAFCRCQPSFGIHSLNERCHGERVAAGRADPAPDTLKLQPCDRVRIDEPGSVDAAISFAQTVLVSVESSHVTRTTPPSSGFGLKK